MMRLVQGGVLPVRVAEEQGVRTWGCWQESGRKCGPEGVSEVGRTQLVALEGSVWSKDNCSGSRQRAVGWCRFQDRAVAGCDHGSGWQK